MEAAIADVIDEGELQRHVARARRVYAERRHILAGAFRRELGDAAEFRYSQRWHGVVGAVSPDVDVERWARRSLARGVLVAHRQAYVQSETDPVRAIQFAWLNERELPEAAILRRAAGRLR